MKKSEIIEVAKVAKAGWGNADYVQIEAGRLALISAVRLLEMVEVIEEGSDMQIGDAIDVTWADGVNGAYTIHAEENLSHWLSSKTAIKIIQRNGLPVITIKKGGVRCSN